MSDEETTNRADQAATMRPAAPSDAGVIASLADMASGGLAFYFWQNTASPGQTPWQLAESQVLQEDSVFSYRKAIVLVAGEEVIACMIGHPIPATLEPVDTAELSPFLIPFLELEAEAASTWYVNFLAVLPAWQGHGHGRRLLARADENALDGGLTGCSLIVSDANLGARRLYERCGYEVIGRRAMVKENWNGAGSEWLLMFKRARSGRL